MEKYEILEKLKAIISEAVEEDILEINRETSASDVDGWDSLAQIMIVSEIKKVFGIKLTSREVSTLHNVGELVDAIAMKL